MDDRQNNVLKTFFIWPLLLGLLLVVLTGILFFLDVRAGYISLGATVLYYGIALARYYLNRRTIIQKAAQIGRAFGNMQQELMQVADIPLAMCQGTGLVFWVNPEFSHQFGKGADGQNLTALFPEAGARDFRKGGIIRTVRDGRTYDMNVVPLSGEGMEDLDETGTGTVYAVYFQDRTEEIAISRKFEEEKAVMGLIYFDNYEEVMEGVEYVRRSLLTALLERKLNKYVSSIHSVTRKLEKDRYFLVMPQEALWQMEEDRFSLLEEIKTVNIGNDLAMTISIGIGMGGDTYEQNYEFAQSAIDMALGRGGDQVVVKNGPDIRYFGGKTKSTERNTRVKARIKAHALRELIEAKDTVLIMGHPLGDMDCLGAGIGIYAAAAYSGKEAHIILGEVTGSLRPVLETFEGNTDYPDDLFITPEMALEIIDSDTLVAVVDTNRPNYTECPELLARTNQVVVMDHHRVGKDVIENALLSYVEPYASSASELVAELIQYYAEDLKLKPAEADAIYAGIVMDTNNFEDKAGVKTFEAAAYLRRCGVDVSRVRKMFRDSMDDYKLRAETLASAYIYNDDYIISICPVMTSTENQTVVAAQAANELLGIRGVKASFVFTEFAGKVYLSARSIDEVNVPRVCEKLGGGGHLSVAGAQFEDITLEEAVERLKEVLSQPV